MGMLEWAQKEIDIACKKENPDWKPGEFDYGCSCYESAMKAYKSLLEDGHSGMSIGFTKRILMRLIDGRPLTPIEDTDDIWLYPFVQDDGAKVYQCKRMSSLFKNVYPDGTVTYNDIDRIICLNKGSDIAYRNGFVSSFIDELDPIVMPYYPKEHPYKIYTEDFLYDEKGGGDYDTRAILYYKDPDGDRHEINRYFKFDNDKPEEIDIYEYLERKSRYEERNKGLD